jgi:hypothetical protein
MKNSAWYHKLWRKKLNTLPVPKDAGAAWAGMKTLLDKNMPAGNSPGLTHPPKPLGAKLITLFTYILPAAAMIGVGLYFLQLKHKTNKPNHPRHKVQVGKAQDSLIITDSLAKDSLFDAITDTVKKLNDTTKASDLPINAPNPDQPVRSSAHKVIKPSTASSHLPNQTQVPFINAQKNGTSAPGDIVQQTLAMKGEQTRADLSKQGQMNVINSTQNGSATVQQGSGDHASGADNKPVPAPVSNSNYGKPMAHEKANTLITADKQKTKIIKIKKPKNKQTQTQDIVTPPYNYGLELGLNTGNKSSFYFGAFGAYALSKRWLVNAGLRINSPRQLSGEYTHATYFIPDSPARFKITDSRKILVLDIPVQVEYKISNLISIKGGPVISFAVRQSNKSSNVIVNTLQDTLYHKKQITADIANTTVNTVNMGFNGGISFHLKQFDINGQYQVLSPYNIKNVLGAYSNTYHTFQVGVSYRFK